jgi:amino acid permease
MGMKVVTICVVCSLVIGVGLIVKLSPSAAGNLPVDSPTQTMREQAFAESARIGPSPVLLFSVGLFGIICVLINERKHLRKKRFQKISKYQQQDT